MSKTQLTLFKKKKNVTNTFYKINFIQIKKRKNYKKKKSLII